MYLQVHERLLRVLFFFYQFHRMHEQISNRVKTKIFSEIFDNAPFNYLPRIPHNGPAIKLVGVAE